MLGNRPRWQGSDSAVENTVKGRRGAGTQNHCMHGKETIVEDIRGAALGRAFEE